jgi:DNA gyrase subunit B
MAPRSPSTRPSADGYSASDLQVLEGLDAVRKRPGMYIGSTDSRGLTHLAFEIVDNAVDEAIAGFCSSITLTVHPDDSVEVVDDGRGIPVDVNPQTKLTGVELVFTKLHAGGKFGGSGYKVAGGLHGVGASVVNALSSRLEVSVMRDGGCHLMSFERGRPGVFDTAGRFTPGAQLRRVKAKAKSTGTTVRYWPDRELFLASAELDVVLLSERLRTTAHLVPNLRITLVDARGAEPTTEVFQSSAGVVDLVSDAATVLHTPFHLVGTGSFTETVPVLSDGVLTTQDVERDVEVDVAFAWSDGFEYQLRSFVNIVATPKGGTHVVGFERALTRSVVELCTSLKAFKASEDPPEKADVLEGLVAVVSVKLPEPQYEGQTKEVLGTAAVNKVVAEVVAEQFKVALAAKGAKTAAKLVADKVVAAARTRRTLRAQRDVIRRKNALESSALPAKLADCRSNDVERTELYIVEGDSSGRTFKAARDAEFQAMLPIRGKILNTLRSSEKKMLENAECAAIIAAVGAGSGRTFNLDQARYQKVIVLADADVDGSHIRCLLLAMCWRHLRPLLEAGRVYAAVPPLHRIAVDRGEVRYTYSDDELTVALAEFAAAGRPVREVQRYKGLGEMDADQLAETTLDPSRRTLRRVTVHDAISADEVFELFMGSDVAPRREYIATHATSVSRESLDL